METKNEFSVIDAALTLILIGCFCRTERCNLLTLSGSEIRKTSVFFCNIIESF